MPTKLAHIKDRIAALSSSARAPRAARPSGDASSAKGFIRRNSTIVIIVVAALAIVAIGALSRVALAPKAQEPAQQSVQHVPPSPEQAKESTSKQLELLDQSDGSKVSADLIALSDTDAISAITDERWGVSPFSTSVVSRAVSDGYAIAADQSGIVKDSVQDDEEGAVVTGDVRIVDGQGVEQGVMPFKFYKEQSNLLFDPIKSSKA